MLRISGGIVSIYANSYTRKTESLHKEGDVYYKIYTPIVQEYMAKNGIKNEEDLPEFFVTAQTLDYKDRIDMQAIWQEYIDASISSTVNVPNDFTVEDIKQLYLYAWEKGLKGVTLFRDGCKRSGILTIDNDSVDSDQIKYDSIVPISRKKIGTTHGSTYCKKCACGTLYVTINRDNDGNVIECFVHTSKGGICQANIGAINRMISLAMRSGVKIEEITDQLKGINCSACVKVKTKGEEIDGVSCPDILAKTIEEFCNQNQTHKIKRADAQNSTDKCPECQADIKHESGCVTCLSCGWSKCE